MRVFQFKQTYGNTATKVILTKSLQSGGFPNFIIFEGPPGTGKSTLAEISALRLTCLEPNGAEPCGHCENCKTGIKTILSEQGVSKYISKFNLANMPERDDITALINKIFKYDLGESNHVFILEEWHTLPAKIQEAFNEEIDKLPKNVYIIICTSQIAQVIKPIKSRAKLVIRTNNLSANDAKSLLVDNAARVGRSLDSQLINLLIEYSEGSPRILDNMIELLKNNSTITNEDLKQFISAVPYEKIRKLFLSYAEPSNFMMQLEDLTETTHPSELSRVIKKYLIELSFLATTISYRKSFLSKADEDFAVNLGQKAILVLYETIDSADLSDSLGLKYKLIVCSQYLKKVLGKKLQSVGVNVNKTQETVAKETAKRSQATRLNSFHKEMSREEFLNLCRGDL